MVWAWWSAVARVNVAAGWDSGPRRDAQVLRCTCAADTFGPQPHEDAQGFECYIAHHAADAITLSYVSMKVTRRRSAVARLALQLLG